MNIQNNEEIIKLREEINKLQVELSFKIQEIKNLNSNKLFYNFNKEEYQIKCVDYLLSNNDKLTSIEKLLTNIIYTDSLEFNLKRLQNKNMNDIIKFAQLQHKRYLNINDDEKRYELFDLNFFSIFV